MASSTENFLVFAGMRNEGPFIVEWVTWYRMLGFQVLIGHNDCTDHSPALMAALARAGWIETFEHQPGNLLPKMSAHRGAREHPATARADWLLICDVDEFLIPHVGDGSIGGYLDQIGRNHQGVAVHWRCFGTGGQERYEDGLVHRGFTRCGPGRHRINVNFKTMFREPLRFRKFADHAPVGFDSNWGTRQARFVDGEGREMPQFGDLSEPLRFTAPEEITHRFAQMNHYVIRTPESYALKRGTPSATAGADRYTDLYFSVRDRNGQRDLSATARAAAFDVLHAEAMALPDVRRLHHLCCADYVERLCANQSRPHEGDARWQHHMAEAGRG